MQEGVKYGRNKEMGGKKVSLPGAGTSRPLEKIEKCYPEFSTR
jgi:hypothetical protein